MEKYFTETLVDRKRIFRGIRKCAEVIASTMGPNGRVVMIDSPYDLRPSPDGITVARYQQYKDPYDRLASKVLISAMDRTLKDAGDGTTATAVLLDALAAALADEDISRPYKVRQGMVNALNDVVDILDTLRWQICAEDGTIDEDALAHTAAISAGGDEELAALITGLVVQIGKDGVVFVRTTEQPKPYTEIHAGYSFTPGMLSPALLMGKPSMKYHNPAVFICNQVVNFIHEIEPVVKKWLEDHGEERVVHGQHVKIPKRPLVIIANDVTGEALTYFTKNCAAYPVAIVRAPLSGDARLEMLEDIRIVTNTEKVYDLSLGNRIKHFGQGGGWEFGTCEVVDVDMKRCVIQFDASAKTADGTPIEGHIGMRLADLRKKLSSEENESVKERLQQRIAYLSSGVGYIYVGAPTSVERYSMQDRADDAQRSCLNALREGVLPGAGNALTHCGRILYTGHDKHGEATDYDRGYLAVLAACRATRQRIYQNAGTDVPEESSDPWRGHLVSEPGAGMVNFKEFGIVDAYTAVVSSLQNAVSAAGQLISTSYFQTVNESENGHQDPRK